MGVALGVRGHRRRWKGVQDVDQMCQNIRN